jgi:hypothetical protein
MGMIKNEGGYTWASCDRCGFTFGVGFNAGKDEAMRAFKQWGWQYQGGKITCYYCIREEKERSA